MDFTFLPRNSTKNKTFARYTIKSMFVPETSPYKASGFYYIGKNTDNIDTLVKVFRRGYAAESLESAKSELRRAIERNENNIIPEIIFCEGHFTIDALKDFCRFLLKHEAFSSIPFVIDATGISEFQLRHLKKSQLPDDIIFFNELDERTLAAKAKFLRKVKANRPQSLANANVEGARRKQFSLNNTMKRSFDILVSSIALLILSPVFLLVALAVKLESKGPVFYISKRAGKGYRIFNFYKFRTMHAGADQKIKELTHLNQYNAEPGNGPVFFKISNDPRITRIGAFLRNSSLDELPQLINVLLGDMSLVGNRPLPLYEAASLTTDEWAKRFMAPAGITGLWQIKKRGKEEMSVEERISLDIDYAARSNFMYDLWIMANTPSALLQKSNV